MNTKQMQTMLIALGYDLGKYGADGYYGAMTANAVRKFQSDYRIDIKWPGTFGPKTESALLTAYNLAVSNSGSTKVLNVQPSTPNNQYFPWFAEAERLIGVTEVSGSKNNPTILSWASKLGGWIADYYTADSIPWCALFASHCISTALPNEPLPSNALSALAFKTFGIACTPQPGAIMVFSRTGGGHIGFYASEDAKYYHILGGNQSDKVQVSKVLKDNCVATRWPSTFDAPTGKRIVKEFDGKVAASLI